MRELYTIEVDRWEKSDKPGMVKHVGMISPREAFDILEMHLIAANLLPDEYFLPNSWGFENVKELPNYIRASCDVYWGGSEGIYLDISLLYHDENHQLQRFNLATGKTLGETGDDFLRMSRIATECSMMLNGRGDIVRFYDEPVKTEKSVEEKLIDAVVEYGLESSWNDSEIIDTLVEMGITKEDFVKYGKYDFVKDYFENNDEISQQSDQPKPLDSVIEETQDKQMEKFDQNSHIDHSSFLER